MTFSLSPEDQEKDQDRFAGQLELIRQSRTDIAEAIEKTDYKIPVPESVEKSLPRLISEIEKIGVAPNSALANRLTRSYAQVDQSLAAVSQLSSGSKKSLCDTFPFGFFCE